MRFNARNVLGSLATAALMMASTAAVAAPAGPAASLSLRNAAPVRAATPATRTNRLQGNAAIFVNIGILAALVVIVLVATHGSDNGSDAPDSP